RRQVLKDTYLSRAEAEAEIEAGGRFKRLNPTIITGAAQSKYPRQPSNSPWHSDPVPPEEPLGYDINSQPELGGAPASLPCAETATPNAGRDGLASSPAPARSFRRV